MVREIERLSALLVESVDRYRNRADDDAAIVLWVRLLEEAAKQEKVRA